MLNKLLNRLVDTLRLRFVGPTLLEDIHLPPIGSSIGQVRQHYGNETGVEQGDSDASSSCHTFEPSEYHQVVVWAKQGKVQAVIFFSANGDPELDLETVMTAYGNDSRWVEINPGYDYRLSDDSIRLWCSVMPGIGVGTTDFVKAQDQS